MNIQEINGNIKVVLKLYNLQNLINEFFVDQDKKYSIAYIKEVLRMYGISQCPNTKDYIIVFQEIYCKKCGNKYTNIIEEWCESCQVIYFKKISASSGNEKIDNLIQEMQLKINYESYAVFEWIPYDKLNDIQEICKDDFDKTYYATWRDGPLCYIDGEWMRESNKMVTLRYLYYSQNIIRFLNKIIVELSLFNAHKIYGISQNPDTEDYIMVFPIIYCKRCNKQHESGYEADGEWCKLCQKNNLRQNFANWASENEKIDKLIQEMQMGINQPDDIIFEWIPYNQFYNIKENFPKENLAITDDLSDYYGKSFGISQNPHTEDYIMVFKGEYNEKCNKCDTDEFLNEVEKYLSSGNDTVYGISQNQDTKYYIIVFKYNLCCKECNTEFTKYNIEHEWCEKCQINDLKLNSKNYKIDNLIQKLQLKFNNKWVDYFEWIPYYELGNIKKLSDNIYLAIWKNDFLYYNNLYKKQQVRRLDLKVTLKYLQNITDKVKVYSIIRYGISQDPNTKDYIIVIRSKYCEKCNKEYTDIGKDWCKPCKINDLEKNFTNWTSGNIKIDKLIQEMQLEIKSPSDMMFEWIPYISLVILRK
ncbi:kinase-like domain-containing protein [Rhizophagus clarus]|uniref:Kinase-like domain-containing protein n=1 Tax=Rhizophagus clarus TaxID=94130 RepID=A0A8H3LV74_9GLOM|nr:kinase-like domain-containing protein [Rhizophagus clarus]